MPKTTTFSPVTIQLFLPSLNIYFQINGRMAEDPNLVDIQNDAEMRQSDSTTSYVSTFFPTSCPILTTNAEVHPIPLTNNDLNTLTVEQSVNVELSNILSEITCSEKSNQDGATKAPSTSTLTNELYTVRQRNPPVELPTTDFENDNIAPLFVKGETKPVNKSEKRKRNSPQTRNVRDKLSQYAYQHKSTKNVSFVLQANDEMTRNVIMEEAPSASSSLTLVERLSTPPPTTRTVPHPPTALQSRIRQVGVRQIQQTEEVQTNPTEDEMRNYEVPETKAPVWRMYEHHLRLVGRGQARLNQINSDIEYDNLPSWCFGGTQAPQYLRPFHEDLITLTHHYAIRMAKTTRNILIRQIQQDTAQARHLQETLIRMYKEDNDPNIDLAIGRAEGIAAHYAQKETILNARLSEEDQVNIPENASEWADILGRRKVTKQTTRGRSRSKSREKTTPANNPKAGKNNPAKQARHNPPSTSTYQPSNNKNKKRNAKQIGAKQQTWTASTPGTSQQGYRNAPSISTSASRPSRSSSNDRNGNPQLDTFSNAQQGNSSNNGPSRPTNLNAEELHLITLLRASKTDN